VAVTCPEIRISRLAGEVPHDTSHGNIANHRLRITLKRNILSKKDLPAGSVNCCIQHRTKRLFYSSFYGRKMVSHLLSFPIVSKLTFSDGPSMIYQYAHFMYGRGSYPTNDVVSILTNGPPSQRGERRA
jgi:hypothetical protein